MPKAFGYLSSIHCNYSIHELRYYCVGNQFTKIIDDRNIASFTD